MDTLELQLWRMTHHYWGVPEKEAKSLIRVLLSSPCARVKTLRERLTLCRVAVPTVRGSVDIDAAHVFREVVTPEFVIRMLNDLQVVGSLSLGQVRMIETSVLQVVTATGAWKARA
jgi:hypothetical protein